MQETPDKTVLATAEDLSFLNAGLNVIAFIKPVKTENGVSYAIHGANGTQYAIADDAATAFGFIKQNDLEPISLH